MRVYIPMTHTGLRELVGSGGLGPTPLVGYAVTPALREWYAAGDEEELEYAALTDAARSALALLAQDDHEQPRRLVVAVDVDEAIPDANVGRSGVELPHVVPMRQVVAVHADTADAEGDVAAAVDVVRSGGPAGADEEFVVASCESHELAWFATQEVGDLLA